ncbi:MAG TPA: cytochrome c oxidase assembly protein [Candidatus Binatia bacterium]
MVLTVLRKSLVVLILFAPLALIAVHVHERGRRQTEAKDPLAVIRSYLKATYARDYRAAYGYISAADQRVRDASSYAQGQGELTGFTARLARTLADFMDLKLIDESSAGDRLKIKVEYSVPTPEDVSSLVWEWNSEKLNSLSTEEQIVLLDMLAARNRSGNLTRIQGHETFKLIREGNAWRIFHDWAAGTKVKVQTALAGRSDVEIKLLQQEIITSGEEPFQINLKINNRGSQRVVLAMRHLIEPPQATDYLEMIDCGLGRAVVLEAGTEQEFSMAYLLEPSVRKNFRDLALTYAFEVKN